ncbi:MAG: trigger factor [Actinomycetota bacterium]
MMPLPMETTVSREGPTRVRMTVLVPQDELRPAVDRAFRRLAGQVKVPGFRPGKAPRAGLEARISHDEIKDLIVRETTPQFYAQAVVDEKIDPVAQPEIDVKSFEPDATLEFEAIIEVRPEINLPDLSTIKVSRPWDKPSAKDIEGQLERLRERFATLEAVERPATKGDFALIDVKGFWNDEEIENATASDMLYEVGSGGVVPELDAEITGKKIGDILKFNATLPSHFGETWGGREVTFQVFVKEVKQKNLPSLDDEFAKTASEFDSLEELRADLTERIAKIKAAGADAEVRSRTLDALAAAIPLAAPEPMVEEEAAYRIKRFSDQLRQAGVSLDEYLSSSDTTEEEIEANIRHQAERSVSVQLILEEIVRREELKITDEELSQEIVRLAEATGSTPQELTKQLQKSGRVGSVAGDILRRKALDLVVDKADITNEKESAE